MPKIDSLIIVGSTCSGKTGLVQGLRDFYGKRLTIPLRYITRPERKNDNLIENQPISKEEFNSLVKSGAIDVGWSRPMEGNRVESYGFETVHEKGKLKIYSANNAIIRDKEANLKDIGVYKVLAIKASHQARVERLSKRSPDLRQEEVEYRLGDDGSDVIKKADYVIDNSDISLEEMHRQAREIIDSLL